MKACLVTALFSALFPAPLFAKSPPSIENPVTRLRYEAEVRFAHGVELRSDAAKARPEFALAATAYDSLWSAGFRGPALALNRARAHRLAGDLPDSLLALREGLAIAPYDRPLQAALAEARSAVAYPAVGELEAQCRPQMRFSIGSHVSPMEAVFLAGGLWLAACLAVTRYFMTRANAWLGFAAVCCVGLLTWGGLWWRDDSTRDTRPLAVVAEEAVLRKGNAASYPARWDAPLPRGVELRVLGERGGWLHVELAGGAAGWLPARSVKTVPHS